jgi:hypothetical protein
VRVKPGWVNAKPRNPCPVCEREDWCAFTAERDVVACRRESAGGKERTDRSGGRYWIHLLGERKARTAKPLPPPVPQPERADLATRHRVYEALLGELQLTERHAENLRGRGLYPDEIARGGYKTLPARSNAGRLVDRFGAETLLKVPGFVRRDGPHGEFVAVGAPPGLLIPNRAANGQIRCVKIRVDDAADGAKVRGGKYRYLSSATAGGPGCDNGTHVPLGDKAAIVRVVEGELKADVCQAATGVRTIGIPGVSLWATAMPEIAALGAGSVVVALDSDCETNQQVAHAVASLVGACRSAGLLVSLERWSGAKGLDDLLASGGEPRLVTGADVDEEIDNLLRSAEAARAASAAGR